MEINDFAGVILETPKQVSQYLIGSAVRAIIVDGCLESVVNRRTGHVIAVAGETPIMAEDIIEALVTEAIKAREQIQLSIMDECPKCSPNRGCLKLL